MIETNNKDTGTPDYALHIPKQLSYPVPAGIAGTVLCALWLYLFSGRPLTAGLLIGATVIPVLTYIFLYAMLKRYTNLERRLEARERFLDEIPWKGDETVLDVGCGNGILILAAVKRLTGGKGIGIDIWSGFAGDSRPEAFRKNAVIEGVADRVTLEYEDVRKLPYDSGSFDVIITGLTMHHLSHGPTMKQAVGEMVRVLKPGGWLGVYDDPFSISHTVRVFRSAGLVIDKKSGEMLFARKPAG